MIDNLSEVKNDVNKVLELIFGTGTYTHRVVYPSTNENLEALFSNFSVKNKDVFSVLASSDQVFTSFYKGAKEVDTFDINKYTFYYHYLRKWLINYYGEEYIKDEYFKDSDKLRELVNTIKVEDENEKVAQMFWILYFNKYDKLTNRLFITTSGIYDSVYKDDLEGLSKKIKNIKFYNLNLASRFKLNKKYDVLIVSNILECMHHPAQLIAARDNIEKLLKKDGICVCSHVMEGKDHLLHQNEVEIMTSNILEYENFNEKYKSCESDFKREVGYVYKKK